MWGGGLIVLFIIAILAVGAENFSPALTSIPLATMTNSPTATAVSTSTLRPSPTVTLISSNTPTPTDTPSPTVTSQPTSTPRPTATSTNTPQPALSANGLILDIVTKHGSDPVPNLLVELRDESGTVLETGRTNEQGVFRIYDIPPGSYSVWYPEDPYAYSVYSYGSFDLAGNRGDAVTKIFPVITLDIEIVSPLPSQPVGSTPLLQWEDYPGVDEYWVHVWVQSNGNADIWQFWQTQETQVQVTKPLEVGSSYQWAVYGYTADGTMLAVSGFGPSHELNLSQQ